MTRRQDSSTVSQDRVFSAFLVSRWVLHGPSHFCSLKEFKQAARRFGQINRLPPFACSTPAIQASLARLSEATGERAIVTHKQRRRNQNTLWIDGLTVVTPTYEDMDTADRHHLVTQLNATPQQTRPREKEIQNLLACQLHGSKTEVPVPMGRVDLVTDNPPLVIEIKHGPLWMHGLGQVLIYGSCFPHHAKVLQLFGSLPANIDTTAVTAHCRAHGVAVWFWPHTGPD